MIRVKHHFPWRLDDEVMELLTRLSEADADVFARALLAAYKRGLKSAPTG